jgi:hypothetical protein
VLVAVVLQPLLDAVGKPEQGQLAQGIEVAGAEVVGQGGIHPLRGVDVTVGHPSAQHFRAHVDQLDLGSGSSLPRNRDI